MSDISNDATDLRSSLGVGENGAFIGKSVSELEEETTRDALTGLANKKGVHLGVARLINQIQRDGDHMLLLIKTDIAFFKPFDDLFSWNDGDKVLVDVAKRLVGTKEKHGIIRSDAVVGNYGGDDFIIATLVNDGESAIEVVNRLVNEGNDLHKCLGDIYGTKLVEAIQKDKGSVLHAFRDLPNDTPVERLTWDQLGIGNLKVGAILLNTTEVEKLPTDVIQNITNEKLLEEFWSQQINPLLDRVMNEKTKKIKSLKSRGTLVTPQMKIVKQWGLPQIETLAI